MTRIAALVCMLVSALSPAGARGGGDSPGDAILAAIARNEVESAWLVFEGTSAVELISSDALLALGHALVNSGDLLRGRRLLVLAEARPDLERLNELLLQITLCECDLGEGRFRSAEQRLPLLEAELERGGLGPYEVMVIRDLAQFRWRLGHFDTALALVSEGLGRLAAAGEQRDVRAVLLITAGLAYEGIGDWQAAIDAYTEVIGLYEGQPTRRDALVALGNRGRVYSLQGELARARDDYLRQYDGARASGDRRLEAASCDALSECLMLVGWLDKARPLVENAVQIQRELGITDDLLFTLDTLAMLCAREGDLEGMRSARDEGRQLLESAEVTALGPRGFAQVRSRYAHWAEVEQALALAEVRAARDEDERRRAIEGGWHQAGRWKARLLLALLTDDSVDSVPPAPGLRDLLSRELGEQSVLVEYAETEATLHAYILFGERLEVVELGDRADLEDQVWDYLRSIYESADLQGADSVARSGKALYEALLEPVVPPGLEGVRRLVVIPSGGLAALPFEGLVVSHASQVESFEDLVYVLDRCEVVVGPSAPVLGRLAQQPVRAGDGRSLFLADPLLVGETVAPDPDDPSPWVDLPRLPDTRGEVAHIALGLTSGDAPQAYETYGRLLSGDSRDDAWRTDEFDLFLGGEAGSAQLSGDLTGYRILHFATHGVVDVEQPALTGLLLAADGVQDGLLSLRAIRDLRLDAELVVLSACQTARGRVLRGEGVQSMAAAFLEAGARGVVASLWFVRDADTRMLMTDFYERMSQGASPSTALREAKLARRRDPGTRGVTLDGNRRRVRLGNGHPVMWSPFVYVGQLR